MRSFGVPSSKTCPQMVYISQLFTCLHVNLANLDIAFLPQEIAPSILKIECGVATADSEVNHNGFRPLSCGIVSPYIEMASRREHRCHHIKASVVVADSGGIDAVVSVSTFQINLRRTSQAVAHLFPVHLVFRVEDRNAREILECAVHQVEVVACTANTRVGVKARKYRVLETSVRCSPLLSVGVDCAEGKQYVEIDTLHDEIVFQVIQLPSRNRHVLDKQC